MKNEKRKETDRMHHVYSYVKTMEKMRVM